MCTHDARHADNLWVTTAQERRTSWRTNRTIGIGIREPHATRNELINCWSLKISCAVTRKITKAQIINQNHDDVRSQGFLWQSRRYAPVSNRYSCQKNKCENTHTSIVGTLRPLEHGHRTANC